MSQFLCLDLRDPNAIPVVVLDDQGACQYRFPPAPPAEVREALAGVSGLDRKQDQVIALVPGEAALQTEVTLPTTKPAQIRQALPYMVEEQLATPLEAMHLAFRQRAGQPVQVAAVEQAQMDQWQSLLAELGLSADAIYLDNQCLPDVAGARLAIVDEQLLVASDSGGLSGPVAEMAPLLENLVDSLAVSQWSLWLDDAALAVQGPLLASVETQLAQQDIPWEQHRLQTPRLEWLARNAVTQRERMLNLMQGAFRPQQQQVALNWRQFRPLAIAVAVLVLLQLLWFAGSGLYFQWQAQQLSADSEAFYRDLFPNARQVNNPRKQLAGFLRTASGSGGDDQFLDLLNRSASALQSQGDWQLQQLRFDRRQGALLLELSAPSIDHLDRIKQQLLGQGLQVEILSANEDGKHVRGRLQIAGG